MKSEAPATKSSLESRTRRYLDIIRQIDGMLEEPALTMVNAANGEIGPRDGDLRTGLPRFPLWISEDLQHAPEADQSVLTRSIVCATLQRLLRISRRFDWLRKQDRLGALERAHATLMQPFSSGAASTEADPFPECRRALHSAVFGTLDPLVASRVFRLLLEAGEEAAHTAMGCLSLFATVWPLCRRYLTPGVRMEPSDPTTYVTAKCLVPLLRLQRICTVRANLLTQVHRALGELARLGGATPAGEHGFDRRNGVRDVWLFTSELDDLRSKVAQLSGVMIARTALARCSDELGGISRELGPQSDPREVFPRVIRSVITALQEVRTCGAAAHRQVAGMAKSIDSHVVRQLSPGLCDATADGDGPLVGVEWLTEGLGLRLAPEYLQSREKRGEYLYDLWDSAKKALQCCNAVAAEFEAAGSLRLSEVCEDMDVSCAFADASTALSRLAEENQKLAMRLRAPVNEPADWCRGVMDREIAHVTAQNIAEFDPSELISAIAVAVRFNLLTTTRQVSDAIQKAVTGQRQDGSWHMGKPFFSPDHAVGSFAPSVDISWTLTSIVEQHPTVRDADEALFRFVEWLERTRVTLRWSPEASATGWPSDRLRHTRRIHLLITALAVDALLEIRDLCEHRLWELCRQRFTVLDERRSLRQVDPVDLGLPHRRRVHGLLSRMINETQRGDAGAEYSLVLHGPPGTSKTALVKALSAELWHSSKRWRPGGSRLVQITPADFTRMGEDRIDSEARGIFELLSHVRGITILFDEIDDLLRKREDKSSLRFMDLVVPAMLNRLQDLRTACPRQEICFVFATNYIERIEEALMRSGRIDRRLSVVYPDRLSRLAQVASHVDALLARAARRAQQLEAKGAGPVEAGRDPEVIALRAAAEVLDRMSERIADATRQWSWMVLDGACTKAGARLVEAARKAAGAPLEKDEVLWEEIRGVLERRGSTIGEPNYVQRLSRSPGSGDLIAEYLAFIFSELPEREQEDRNEAALRAALRVELASLHEPAEWVEQFNDTLARVRADPLSYLDGAQQTSLVVDNA